MHLGLVQMHTCGFYYRDRVYAYMSDLGFLSNRDDIWGSSSKKQKHPAEWDYCFAGVGIDVPTIGDLFHITKTSICMEMKYPLPSWVM